MKITEFMDKDHIEIGKLFDVYLERYANGSAAYEIFAQFRHRLERHMAWEEEVLFKISDDVAGKDNMLTGELRLQHDRIKELLSKIQQALKDGSNAKIFNDDLFAVMSAHEKMEDDSFYSWLDDTLDEKVKNEALASIAAVSKRYKI